MRKLIGALLAMTALMPAAGHAQDGRRNGSRVERQTNDVVRAARRAERQERRTEPQHQVARAERRENRQDFRADRQDDARDFRRERRDDRQALRAGAVTAPRFRADRRDDRQDFRAERRDDRQDLRRDQRDDRRGYRNRNDRGDWARSRFGGDAGAGYNDWNRSSFNGGGGNWNRGWRQDDRYDWNRYRGVNRSAYRLPRYYAPIGWGGGYRRFGIGISLQSQLWGQNYWIADPYSYRLPDAYGPYRWVRYYDDALLVDLRSGLVVDAVYGIFW